MEETYLYNSAGTISFISKCYGGCASDRFITEDCQILDKLQYGDNLIVDKGFNISDLSILKGSQLFHPFWERNNDFQRKTAKGHRMLQKPEYILSEQLHGHRTFEF